MRQSRAQAVAIGVGLLLVAVGAGALYARRRAAARPGLPFTYYDYSGRSGFPRPVEEMRGKARQRVSAAINA